MRTFLPLGFTVKITTAEGQEAVNRRSVFKKDCQATIVVDVNMAVGLGCRTNEAKELGA